MKQLILPILMTAALLPQVGLATSLHPLTHAGPAIDANNRVGLKLAREAAALELAEKGSVSNQMYSPISLYSAVSMLQLGISGRTQTGLRDVLGLSPAYDLHGNNQELLAYHRRQPELTHTCATCPKPAVVGIENSAWSNHNTERPYAFSLGYMTGLESYYQADVRSLDFKAAGSADVINQWAEEKTRGLIKNVMKADVLKQLKWVLMNATYVEANWAQPFNPMFQGAPVFTTAQGGVVYADMIRSQQRVATLQTKEFAVAEIPFHASDLAFYVVLPNSANDFQRWVQNGEILDETFWTSTLVTLRGETPAMTELVLPKFAFSSQVELLEDSELTAKLGLGFLFDGRRAADFRPMGDVKSPDTVVGLIKQDNKIELDEYGVKAAAVTLIGGIERTSVNPVPKTRFVVDRPFFYAIASRSTGTLMFVGAVADPSRK